MGCGHPDKVADAISDAILDACLTQDPESRVGCETLVKGNQVILAGEITTKAKLDYEHITRKTVELIGYRTAQEFHRRRSRTSYLGRQRLAQLYQRQARYQGFARRLGWSARCFRH